MLNEANDRLKEAQEFLNCVMDSKLQVTATQRQECILFRQQSEAYLPPQWWPMRSPSVLRPINTANFSDSFQ